MNLLNTGVFRPAVLALGLMLALPALLPAAMAAPADLPPEAAVQRVLQAAPALQAAGSQVRVEEANRRRLEAGPHEWTLRFSAQRRRAVPQLGAEDRYREHAAAVERTIRLPGKAGLDAELGARGVAVAEAAREEARHEFARSLLEDWFAWLREGESARQWGEQVGLLSRHAAGVTRRQQLGDAAQLEAVQSEAALAQAEAQWAQARVRERQAAEELRRRYPELALPAAVPISEPAALTGSEDEWLAALLEQNHELRRARLETQRSQLAATRSDRERLPDPTLGVHLGSERNGEERLLGVSIAFPLPGQARRAGADAAFAQADIAGSQEAGTLRRVSVEAASLYHAASAAHAGWESSRSAAARSTRAADRSEERRVG